MDLLVKSTGSKFYRIESGVAALLMNMFPGELERIVSPTEAPRPGTIVSTPESWRVGPTGTGVPSICYTSKSKEVLNYTGTPDGAKAAYKLSHADLPDEILAQYRAMYNRTMAGSAARQDGEGR